MHPSFFHGLDKYLMPTFPELSLWWEKYKRRYKTPCGRCCVKLLGLANLCSLGLFMWQRVESPNQSPLSPGGGDRERKLTIVHTGISQKREYFRNSSHPVRVWFRHSDTVPGSDLAFSLSMSVMFVLAFP